MAPPVVLKLDLPYYNREQLAAAAGVSLATVKNRLAAGDLAYDAEIVGKVCFSRDLALKFCKAEHARKVKGRAS